MTEFSRPRGSILTIPLLLLLAVACSRRAPDVPSEGAVPSAVASFETQADGDPADNESNLPSAKDNHETKLPFQNSQTIPAGTLLIVSLKDPIVAGNGSKEPFEGIVDQPVVLDGTTLIPREAIVSGRIESTHLSNLIPERGYVRLSLNSVIVDGESVPIQTASLFARQLLETGGDSGTIRLRTGRRLTFRLKQPVYFHVVP